MWSREMLKSRAKGVLRTSYWKAFLVSLVLGLATGGVANLNTRINSGRRSRFSEFSYLPSVANDRMWTIIGSSIAGTLIGVTLLIIILKICIGFSLEVGGQRYFINAAQDKVDIGNLGYGFKNNRWLPIIKTLLLRDVITFLWTLLLIIPGIIKSYEYSMVDYILAENPSIGHNRALELSKQMTYGEKFDMLILDLSFLGWELLGMLAFGIGGIFVSPYKYSTKAELYLVLRQEALEAGLCTIEELTEETNIVPW